MTKVNEMTSNRIDQSDMHLTSKGGGNNSSDDQGKAGFRAELSSTNEERNQPPNDGLLSIDIRFQSRLTGANFPNQLLKGLQGFCGALHCQDEDLTVENQSDH